MVVFFGQFGIRTNWLQGQFSLQEACMAQKRKIALFPENNLNCQMPFPGTFFIEVRRQKSYIINRFIHAHTIIVSW
jgi:hypothetical protein